MFTEITDSTAYGTWYAEDEDFFDLGLKLMVRVTFGHHTPKDRLTAEDVFITEVHLDGNLSAMAAIAARENQSLKEEIAEWLNDHQYTKQDEAERLADQYCDNTTFEEHCRR
jgi:hypothetical protein